jgi:hypothetical protein
VGDCASSAMTAINVLGIGSWFLTKCTLPTQTRGLVHIFPPLTRTSDLFLLLLALLPTAHLKPLGLGSSNLPHQPLGACPRGARNLRRQWTTAKPRGGDVSCNVLPFFLDLSLAFAPGVEFFDAVKSSVDSEVVFQATLQVRMRRHQHVICCPCLGVKLQCVQGPACSPL